MNWNLTCHLAISILKSYCVTFKPMVHVYREIKTKNIYGKNVYMYIIRNFFITYICVVYNE